MIAWLRRLCRLYDSTTSRSVALRRRWNSFWRWTSRQWTWPRTSAVWCLQDHLFSQTHVGSLTVGKLVDKIQFCSKWYCDHKQLFEITQIQLSVVRFQILAKSLPVCGLHVPCKTLTRLICPLPSPLLEQQKQQFRNVLQWKIQLSGAEKKKKNCPQNYTPGSRQILALVAVLYLTTSWYTCKHEETLCGSTLNFSTEIMILLYFIVVAMSIAMTMRCRHFFSVSVFQYCILSDGL